jgi:predicted PhzF superfamily epimerase YddE/YHI9
MEAEFSLIDVFSDRPFGGNANGSFHLRIDQGVTMDRPSLLDASARKEHGEVTEVSVWAVP